MVSDFVSEPPTKKIRSLTVAIINAAEDSNLTEKLTITQEEGSVASSTTHVEEAWPETPKASTTSSTKEMQQKRSANMMVSSKTWNYHIRDILYNIFEYNIFQNKK